MAEPRPRPAASAVPWRGIAMLLALCVAAYALLAQTPAPVASAAPALPGLFSDQFGRIEWSRVVMVGGAMGLAASAAAWLLAPHFKARARALRMEDRPAWAEDVFAAFEDDPERGGRVVLALLEHHPDLARAVILKMFVVEAEERREALKAGREAQREVGEIHRIISDSKILTDVPEILRGLRSVTDSMGDLARDFRALVTQRQSERVADREEMGELRATVKQIQRQTTYRGADGEDHPEQRQGDRRVPKGGT